MSVILNDMELPKDCMKCPLDNFLICKVSHGLCTSDYRPSHCPLKSIEGLIEKIEHITPKATIRYGKLSIDSCLMIPVHKVIETIKEYCEV